MFCLFKFLNVVNCFRNDKSKIQYYMKNFLELSLQELIDWLERQGHQRFHAEQIYQWIYQKAAISFDEMSNLSKELRKQLNEHFTLSGLELVKVTPSEDKQTFKFLYKLTDGKLVEAVLICADDRRTVCVSSQVGCPAKCAFCASGKMGFFRNLHPGEIVGQVLHINKWLERKKERVCHIVFMGMGEPLKNYESVIRSIHMLTDPKGLALSPRRITVSTVGVVEGIRRLAREGIKVNLVLSLHAPNQRIRQKIIPYARKYPLEDILAAMDDYAAQTKRIITYEYTLIAGINDHPDHAFELAHLLAGKHCTINLIPYNPVAGLKLRRPEKKAIKDFRSVLFGARITNTCRYTKGDDIAAACGQLALQEAQESPLKLAS